jgi:hypothetical protein
MKFAKPRPFEYVIIIIFIIYLIFPTKTPVFIANIVDSIVGLTIIFVVSLYLFIYTNPILAISFVFVAYELLRRSSNITVKTAMIQYIPTQDKIRKEEESYNVIKETTLEEEVVEIRAPITSTYDTPTFKSLMNNTNGASLYV